MDGAEGLLRSLVGAGVTTMFANPGTSEMHAVAALDRVPEMRAVLGLFEGVVTGAADGYGRLTGTPAAALLHLGPGLGNGLANLHNARRARTPLVAVVGDHAHPHVRHDAPLQSDIESVARTVSGWVRTSRHPRDLGRDGVEAVAAASAAPGQVATLVVPADVAWSPGGQVAAPRPVAGPAPVPDDVVRAVAAVLRSGEPALLFLGGRALRAEPLRDAARVAAAAGARLLAETFPARFERGADLPAVERLAYLAEAATAQLAGVRHLILVDAAAPASFFAYPGKPSDLVPEACEVHVLARGGDDPAQALAALAAELSAPALDLPGATRPGKPSGALDLQTFAAAVGAALPEQAVVVDEANTSGALLPAATAGAPRHDWLTLTGGAIGQGLPVAVGAAVAAPDRPVVCLEADGSALYTIQSLWTMAREQLDVTVVLVDNGAYAILRMELARTGAATGGTRAAQLFDLTGPAVDFMAVARGFGVDAVRVERAEDLVDALERCVAEPGPHLVHALVPPIL
ncbi:MAG: acetolactate synthase large subunit [Motilibacteraceae bacterium]